MSSAGRTRRPDRGYAAEMRQAREPIACLTAYDASFAQLVDMAGTDVVPSATARHGPTRPRYDGSRPVADVVYPQPLRRPRRAFALLMVDMPFMSYTTPAQARQRHSLMARRRRR